MEQTVYVDLFFMINFSMDFLCFFLASQILSSKLRLVRTILASVIGGVYAVLSLFSGVGGLWAVVIDIGVCVLMCLIAFGKDGSPAVHTVVYLLVSMILGGFMTALFALLNRAELPLTDVGEDGISAWVLIILAVVSGAMTLGGGRFFRRRSAKKYADVVVYLEGRSRRLRAFCDSGNLLRDPLSGKICVLANMRSLGDILPRCLSKPLSAEDTVKLCEKDKSMARRIRLIPTSTAVGKGMLVAVRVDKLTIAEGKGERELDALLALCDTDGFGDGCDALLPSELLI